MLTVGGVPIDVKITPVPLEGAQWNYISYLPQINTTLKEGLAGYVASDEECDKIANRVCYVQQAKRMDR